MVNVSQVYLGDLTYSDSVAVYSVQTPHAISLTGSPAKSESTRGLSVADSDGDGWADVLIANTKEQNQIYYGDGRGGFKSFGSIGNSPKQTHSIVVGDLSNDGNLDVVTGNMGSSSEVTVGSSVWVPFDLSAIASRESQLRDLNLGAFQNGIVPNITAIEIVVGQLTYNSTNFDGYPDAGCRNPSDPYYPVTTRMRIDFPPMACVSPECVILSPLEAIEKAVGAIVLCTTSP